MRRCLSCQGFRNARYRWIVKVNVFAANPAENESPEDVTDIKADPFPA